ncbi:MAG: helix-hairpin-helix domain-containing protein, partial [Oscillospiraceae bacterium]
KIPAFGMVKDNRHRTRAITAENGEIAISPVKNIFAFITSVQDEVHRFTISYARASHGKNAFQSELLLVQGIGKARAIALFKHFKTKKAILEATEEELAAAPKMNKKIAKTLREAIAEGKIS